MEWVLPVFFCLLAAGLILLLVCPRLKQKRAVAKRDGGDTLRRADEIFRGVQLKAGIICDAYGKLLQSEHTGFVRRESDLPASREKIKASIILQTHSLKLDGQLSNDYLNSVQVAFGGLAIFVADEQAVRSERFFQVSKDVVERPPTDAVEREKLVEKLKDLDLSNPTPSPDADEFSRLCDEFKERMDALTDPQRGPQELLRIMSILSKD